MKKFIIEFLKRGALFAGLGPVILAVIYIFLSANGVVETIAVSKLITEILTSTLMAFIAAGISAVYKVEKLQIGIASLIQGSVLFFDYIIVYLLNGWIPFKWNVILVFTVIFVVGFLLIWAIIYLSIRHRIKKMNEQLG
ncbi:MAG: DUF3021 domain-containing protein [Eubacteriales bacterium]|nr:DUF3021 domain-containing protein [Eubacteriales bacterium]